MSYWDENMELQYLGYKQGEKYMILYKKYVEKNKYKQ